MERANKPTAAQLKAAEGKEIPDVIAPGLGILFVGINPGLYSAAIGHHFGRPGNRFWPALKSGRITDRELSPYEDQKLLDYQCGITNLVARASGRADELTAVELQEGAERLQRLVMQFRPRIVAVLGIGPYRIAFQEKHAVIGPQSKTLAATRLWVLPNPSGLNAHYQLSDFGRLLARLREASR